MLAKKDPPEKHSDDRVDVIVDTGHSNRQPVQHITVGAVAHDGSEYNQINNGSNTARAPSGRMGLRKQSRHRKCQAGGQLLHGAAYYWMRLGLMPALQDGTQAPASTAEFDQQEATHQGTAETF